MRIIIKPTSTGKFVAYVEGRDQILASTVRPTREQAEAWVTVNHSEALRWAPIEHWSRSNRP